jgi:hypothetical protein
MPATEMKTVNIRIDSRSSGMAIDKAQDLANIFVASHVASGEMRP